jgi:hypothetical protein
LVEVFRSYISYLLAARQLSYRAAWAGAVTLNSAEEEAGDIVFGRNVITFPVSRGDLLRTHEVADTAYGLLATEV